MDTSHFINGGAKTLCLTVELSTRKYLPPCTEFPFLLIIGAHVGVLKGKTLADRKKTELTKSIIFLSRPRQTLLCYEPPGARRAIGAPNFCANNVLTASPLR